MTFDYYQTDFDGYIRKGACLLFTLFSWAVKGSNISPDKTDIYELIDILHHERKAKWDASGMAPAIGGETDCDDEGVYVYDHEQVYDAMAERIGSPWRLRYRGCMYMPWEVERGKASFGERKGEVVILQIKTLAGNGHFRNAFYDPYQPMPGVADLKSIRYYSLYEVKK